MSMVKYHIGERVGRQGRLAVGCSAAVFDSERERILLVRRSDNSRWAVPGGYMDSGETLTETCVREVLEETGLHARVKRLIGVYTNPNLLLEYPDGNCVQLVVLHFEAEPIGGKLGTSEETTDVKYFTEAEIAGLDMGSLDRSRVTDSFAVNERAMVHDTF